MPIELNFITSHKLKRQIFIDFVLFVVEICIYFLISIRYPWQKNGILKINYSRENIVH